MNKIDGRQKTLPYVIFHYTMHACMYYVLLVQSNAVNENVKNI